MDTMTLKRTLTTPSRCYLDDRQISPARYGQLASMAHVCGYEYHFATSGGVDCETITAPLAALLHKYRQWISIPKE